MIFIIGRGCIHRRRGFRRGNRQGSMSRRRRRIQGIIVDIHLIRFGWKGGVFFEGMIHIEGMGLGEVGRGGQGIR